MKPCHTGHFWCWWRTVEDHPYGRDRAAEPYVRAEWLVAAVDGVLFEWVAGVRAAQPVDRAALEGVARWLTRAALG